MDNSNIDAIKLFKKARKISNIYGFTSLNSIKPIETEAIKTKISSPKKFADRHSQHVSQVLKWYLENNYDISQEPLFLFHSNIEKNLRETLSTSSRFETILCSLTIVGIEDSYAEALLASCVSHIFKNNNANNPTIRLNSFGTKKDASEYLNRLNSVLRKSKNSMSNECRRAYEKDGALSAHPFIYKDEKHLEIIEQITPSIRLLSDGPRIHLHQLIEHLESQQLPYEIANDLIEDMNVVRDTVFEIIDDKKKLCARGGRFDALANTCYNVDIPVVSINITLPEKTEGKYKSISRNKKPKGFLLLAGDEARKNSFSIFKMFADLNIPINHRVKYRTVQQQLENIENEYPFIFIFGQTEMENKTLRVKNTETQSIDIIPLNKPNALKALL